MTYSTRQYNKIKILEQIISKPTGRGSEVLAKYCVDELLNAACSLAAISSPKIILTTGFFIPDSQALETDGPSGTMQMLKAFSNANWQVKLLAEANCQPFLEPLAEALRLESMFIQSDEASIQSTAKILEQENYTHLIACERAGFAEDTPYSMRGLSLRDDHAKLDLLFDERYPWTTIAIGDGGNELGMGKIDHDIIAKEIHNGEMIHCRTAARHLIFAAVSNWGAFALIKALSILRSELAGNFLQDLSVESEKKLLEHCMQLGIIDGILGKVNLSVDALEFDAYSSVLKAILEV